MTKLKTASVQTTYIVDKETGEILDEQIKRHTYIAESKEQFYIGYIGMLPIIRDLSGQATKVYAYLLQFEQPGKPIGIIGGIKDEIRKAIGSASAGNQVIDRCLKELVEANLLIKGDSRGVYYLNPRYAFKGSTKERDKSLKAMIELVYTEA
jgi:hypothetical protein